MTILEINIYHVGSEHYVRHVARTRETSIAYRYY
jgi:hypothetical protein